MEQKYDAWLRDVQAELRSIGMGVEEWQRYWQFDFYSEFKAGTQVKRTAVKANRFWWWNQNRVLGEECRVSPYCWLPDDHQGRCQTIDGTLIAINRKNGTVEKIEGSRGSFDQQYTTIDGKIYWTWLGVNDGVKAGVKVEFTEKLNHRVGPRSNPVRADVAEDLRVIGT